MAETTDGVVPRMAWWRLVQLGLIAFTAFLFFSGPMVPWGQPYETASWGWDDYERKLRDPWLDLSQPVTQDDQYQHLPKLNYRMAPVLLGYVLRLDRTTWPYLGMVLCALAAMAMISLAYRRTGDEKAALGFGLMFAGLAAASQSVRSFTGHFDCVGFCLLAWAVASVRWPVVAGAMFLACWTDQRAALIAPFVALAHAMGGPGGGRFLEPLRPTVVAVGGGVAAWMGTFAAALVLSGMPFNREGIRLEFVLGAWDVLPVVLWGALEAGWVVWGMAVVLLWQGGHRLIAVVMAAGTASYVMVGLSVLDLTRSLAYLVPILAVALVAATRLRPELPWRMILCGLGAVSLLAQNTEVIARILYRNTMPLWQELLLMLRVALAGEGTPIGK